VQQPQPEQLVVDFLNTLDVEDGADRLATVSGWSEWAGEPQDASQLSQARALRKHLRTVAAGGRPDGALRIPLTATLEGESAWMRGESPVARIAAAVVRLSVDGRLGRVKICPADDCRCAFYDTSRNHSRQWCSMRVCGNRSKVQRHRRRSS